MPPAKILTAGFVEVWAPLILLPNEVGTAPEPKVNTSIPVEVVRTARVPVVSTPTPVDARPPLPIPAAVSVLPLSVKVWMPLLLPRTTVVPLVAIDAPVPDKVAAAVVEARARVEVEPIVKI